MTSTGFPLFVSVETVAYSGATLLAFLLGTHPQIATIGEMDGLIPAEDPDKYLCSCGQRIKTCDFWRSVTMSMQDRGFEFDVAHFDMGFPVGGSRFVQYLREGSSRVLALDSIRDAIFYMWPGEKRRLRALVARNEAFVEAVLEVTGKDVFVDTSKNTLRLKSLGKLSSLDVRAIHLVRDVRGVVASHLRRDKEISAGQVAARWVKSNTKIRTGLSVLPEGATVLVRYEDLCQDTQGALEKLYRFCGVDPDIEIEDFRTISHHIVGNPMRLGNRSEIKLDERWKSMLTEDQIREIDRIAGSLNRRYGYYQ